MLEHEQEVIERLERSNADVTAGKKKRGDVTKDLIVDSRAKKEAGDGKEDRV